MKTIRIIATALSLPEERAGRCPPDPPNPAVDFGWRAAGRSRRREGLSAPRIAPLMITTKIAMITIIIITKNGPLAGGSVKTKGGGAGLSSRREGNGAAGLGSGVRAGRRLRPGFSSRRHPCRRGRFRPFAAVFLVEAMLVAVSWRYRRRRSAGRAETEPAPRAHAAPPSPAAPFPSLRLDSDGVGRPR